MDIASFTDAINGMWPTIPTPAASRRFESLRDRTFELMAHAMSFASEGDAQAARDVMKDAIAEVEQRRDSVVRMKYVFGNVSALFIILALVIWVRDSCIWKIFVEDFAFQSGNEG